MRLVLDRRTLCSVARITKPLDDPLPAADYSRRSPAIASAVINQRTDRRGVLQRGPHHLRGVDDAGLDHVLELGGSWAITTIDMQQR